jgi:hypothetical protein
METFIPARPFTADPAYEDERRSALRGLKAEIGSGAIDLPLLGLLKALSCLSHCFTLQSCFGHFVHGQQQDTHNTAPLSDISAVPVIVYRIAYLAVCLRDNEAGRELFEDLRRMEGIDPGYVQFGSADWFWGHQVNTYVVQVEPLRFRDRDCVTIGPEEALHIERVRDLFFLELETIVAKHRWIGRGDGTQ